MDPSSSTNQLQPYVIETFPINCNKFYRAIIDSSFWGKVSTEMGFYDMNEGGWTTSPTGCHQERELNFKTPISFKIGPKVASVCQKQRIRRTPNGGYFMETSSVSRDVPYGESFSVENYISLEPSGDSCLLKVSTAVKFTKSIWGVRGLIEKSVIQSNKDFFVVWVKMARKTLENPVAAEQQRHYDLNGSVAMINGSPLSSSPMGSNTPPLATGNKSQTSPLKTSPTTTTATVPVVAAASAGAPAPLSMPVPVTATVPTMLATMSNAQQQGDHTTAGPMPINYEEIKRLFFQLFRETQNPRTVKLISQRTDQHVANITIHVHYTVGHVIQYLIPQALPELTTNQNFEVFWLDKQNINSLFFSKDMDLPMLNYLQSQAIKKSLCFEVIQSGKRAIIKSNHSSGISL
ncbi:hypothetical protein SAMD00019534_118080 [Acytostelium subglobosum LB1]|uniref:hypothetical protein n=1 Tax=Acytostelium subglobosum LB1 TaxID=1410327 RepID=UPI0006449727|nr:hypothetical protein SAMD00019534_118080 [Acytostelium subglobosum LB1]GAM28632.1 hypothetical protein SAMD00019534_118080 [Acytostelium subglobosum LB1]|eukprot:XP_012748410.1 hypothetical protein SAMD00019534_118080 [Acytostelium subglobosum LB1]